MGLIHDHLSGKTVNAVLTNGHELIVQCTSGEEIVIGWGVNGPVLLRQDVRLALPPVLATGIGNGVWLSQRDVTRTAPLAELFGVM